MNYIRACALFMFDHTKKRTGFPQILDRQSLKAAVHAYSGVTAGNW